MKLLKRIPFYIALIAVLIFLGFFRDYLFVNINYQLSRLYYHNDSYTLPENLELLNSFSYIQLYYGKWLLTFVFCILYFFITQIAILKIFKKTLFTRWSMYFHLFILTIAALFFISGIFFDNYDKGYTLSRVFMGVLQSPIVLMILIPAFQLMAEPESRDGSPHP